MKILFITPSYKPAFIYGGPVVVIALLAESLVKLGHEVTVYTTTANGKAELDVKAGKMQLLNGVKVFYFKRVTGDHTHLSPALWWYLSKKVRCFNVVHLHSWWNLLIIGAALVCRMNKVVPVISPHGMFSDYILLTNNSRIKKWVQAVVGKKLLTKTILHVSTDMEWRESQKIIPGWRGMVIPNLVTLSDVIYKRNVNPIFTIGFLSRIDPKKGLDKLITALSEVNFPYKLLIAGSGENQYVEFLKSLSKRLGNNLHIDWVGWKNEEEKFEYLSKLDLFALTSHSENFAIVVIESLSVGTPVLLSDQVGLYNYVEKNDYGWITTTEVRSIAESLINIQKEKDKIKRINTFVPSSIQEHYKSANLAKQYIDLYSLKISL